MTLCRSLQEKKEKKEKTAEEKEKKKEKKEKKARDKESDDEEEDEAKPPPPPEAPRQPRRPPPPVEKPSAYMSRADLPSSESEDEGERRRVVREVKALTVTVTAKDEMKAKRKEALQAQKVAAMKEAMLRDDRDAFQVRVAKVGDSQAEAMAHSKDVKVDSFSVSARGKVLLENTSFTLVAGRRYGLVGPNGKGKSTLLKLLAWRKIPVPDAIDVLMVEQEVA